MDQKRGVMQMITNRRGFFALAGLAAVSAGASARAAEACFDPAALPFSQKSRRRAVEYHAPSEDPARHCSACTFFTAAAPGCGTCAMLAGGPVDGMGLCSSFTVKQ